MKKVIAWIAGIALAAAGVYFGLSFVHEKQIEQRRRMAEKGISNCSELVSYKCRYTSVVYKDKALALARNTRGYSIVRYTGMILGGIADISAIKMTVSEDGKGVSVTLPPAQILSNDIEKEEAITESGTFLRVSAEDMLKSIDNAREEVEESLVADGFLRDADKYAADAIKQMMEAVKFSNIEVQTEGADNGAAS